MKNIEDIELKTQIFSKLAIIEKIFEKKSVAVAFSGGIDSSFLLYLAKSYATSVLPIFFNTPTTPTIELNHALKISETFGLKLHKIDLNTLEQPEIAHNGLQRCYFCKSYLLKILIHEATKNNFEVYADGTNFSDLGAIRPGLKALRESKVISPLAQAELLKSEIIEISRQLELPSANFMSQACLASRIPFNIDLNSKILKMVDSAEQFLFENFPKYHGSIR
ncbi:MAG: 7-cyano-7-deazaguanine synthase, partial [Promethearchaeota archaeon]